ncbi:MAG: Lrp/AsnC family transcriptional regulator [Candidatus Thorarchaeota archaeon]|nr:Lrp/AsnC family transcriptional regulator [Candidatus Thorarchaeota archaeon]
MSMVKAYVLIKTIGGKEDAIIRELLKLSVTEEAHKVFGPYDIIVEIRGRDMEAIVDILLTKIRPISGLIETQSLLVIDAELDMLSTNLGT